MRTDALAVPAPAQTQPVVLTIGGFDGLHLGHQEIIRRVRELAREINGISALLTFHPLPGQVILPDFPYILTPLDEKMPLLAELGIEFTRVLEFDARLQATEPEDFIHRYIISGFKPAFIVIGADHRFGKQGRGNPELLQRILQPRGTKVEVMPEFLHLGAPVRSTRIREHLLLGHVRLAAELLGRPYTLTGRVVPGTGTGRKLGFPTINLQPLNPEKLIPLEGVYAVIAECVSSAGTGTTTPGRFPAVLNIGFRPTFGGRERTIEAHLLDYPENAGEFTKITIHFLERLRPERPFTTTEELRQQISQDIRKAQEVLQPFKPMR